MNGYIRIKWESKEESSIYNRFTLFEIINIVNHNRYIKYVYNIIYKLKMAEENIDITICDNPNAKEEYKFKVVVVGDSGVGKTNLIHRFVNNTFNKDSKATVGVEFLSKTFVINKEIFKIEIWDTAGQERYKAITAAYYKGAKGAMIVYDVTNQNSFDNVNRWSSEIREKASKNINLIMVGNKTDLTDSIAVNSEMSQEKAKSLNMAVMETSALDSSNVQEAFFQLLKEMYKSVKALVANQGPSQDKIGEAGVQLNTNTANQGKKKKCC